MPDVTILTEAELRRVVDLDADAGYKSELAPDVIPAADRYVCDSLAQCLKQGELRPAVAAGTAVADSVFPELGQAIATLAYERAAAARAGRVIVN